MSKIDIGKIDSAMAIKPANTEGVAWYLPFEAPMTLLGFNWFGEDGLYERLPVARRPESVHQYPEGVEKVIEKEKCGALTLSAHTAGGQVRFRTDSSRFLVSAVLGEIGGMDHMAFTGSAGFDLYLKCGGVWKCFGVTRTDHQKADFVTTIVSGVKREMRDVIINMPLYNSVKQFSIGLDEDAKVEMATPFSDGRPIVYYGTSIEQGGCATRPGMASTNIMSRMLERYVINQAYSGSGRGEPEIAEMLADIQEPAMYIIGNSWNQGEKELYATMFRFVDIIREKHPDTPILFVSPTPGRHNMDEIEVGHTTQRWQDGLLNVYQSRKAAGDKNVYFFDAFHESLGDDYWECTVDGAHMTDLGFLRFSQAICPIIERIFRFN